MPKNQIPIENFNLGGLADSNYQGIANSLAVLDCIDIHTEPGIIRANTDVVNERSLDNDFIRAIVPYDNDTTLFFGSEFGTVWSRSATAVYTNLGTITTGWVLDAVVFEGYVYYATATYLGRWQVGTAFGTRVDNWATFTNADSSYHPMKALNKVLYIGAGNVVDQVESGVFTGSALDLEPDFPISCLGIINNDLLIGTHPVIKPTRIFRWNTYSLSFTSSDPVPEYGISCFLETDNIVLVAAGTKGKIYQYDGEKLQPYKQIPGNPGNEGFLPSGSWGAIVYPNAAENLNGLPIFGLSASNGTPAKMGVYSLGWHASNFPTVLNFENRIDSNVTTIRIGAIKSVNRDTGGGLGVGYVYNTVFYTWKNPTSGRTGIAVSSLNRKNEASFESRVITYSRNDKKQGQILVPYRSIPDGTFFATYVSVNYWPYEQVDLTIDTARRIMFSSSRAIPSGATYQIKGLFGTSGLLSAEIEGLILNFE